MNKMNKRLLFSCHSCTWKKMKAIILVINAFVLVKTQNETSLTLPPSNNIELLTATINSTSTNAFPTNISMTSITTTNISNTTVNITTQQDTNSDSPLPTAVYIFTKNSTTSGTTTDIPHTTINITTQQDTNSTSPLATAASIFTNMTTTSKTITYIPNKTVNITTQQETNSNSPLATATSIFANISTTSGTTTDIPNTTINIRTQHDTNSTSPLATATSIFANISITSVTTTNIPNTTINITTQQDTNSKSPLSTLASTSTNKSSISKTTRDIPNTTVNITTQPETNSTSPLATATSIFTNISTTSETTTVIPYTTLKTTTQQETKPNSPPGNHTKMAIAITKPAITIPRTIKKAAKPQKHQKEITSTLSRTIKTKQTTTTAITSTTTSKDWPYTKILTKKKANIRDHNDKSVQISVPEDGDFLSFIRNSSMWVDKSLLIPRIGGVYKDEVEEVKVHKAVTFTIAPPKWGKTINLSMLKFYFELPTNSDGFPKPREESASYKYFKEGKVVLEDGSVEELDGIPLISNHKACKLANHPVIYIKGANFIGDVESFRSMIHQTYHSHESLLKRLQLEQQNAQPNSTDHQIASEELRDFLTYYDWDKIKNHCSETKLLIGIEILSKLLSQTYKSPTVILYDDYDNYIHNTFLNLDHFNTSIDYKTFPDFFEIFMSNTFKYNEYRTTSVITGVVRANFPDFSSDVPNLHRSYADFCSLFPFYGIFQPEFDQMVRKRGIDRALSENATQWYGGYLNAEHLDIPMYSTHSVTRFISTLQVRDYWPKSHLIGDFINDLLSKPEMQEDVETFIHSLDGNKISFGIHYSRFQKLSLPDYRLIRLLQLGQVKYLPNKLDNEYAHIRYRDIVFSLLVYEGYAAVHENQTGGSYGIPNDIHITLPNREIYNQLSNLTNKL